MSGLTDSGNFDAYGQPVITLWNSSTPAGAVGTGTGVVVTTAGLDTIALTFSTAAGISGGVVSFYAFDGTNYIPIKCPYISNYTTASSITLSGSQTVGFTVPIAGYPAFQYVLTTAITGTGNVTITTISSSAPDVSIVSAGIDPASTGLPVAAGAWNTGQQNSIATSSTLIVAARAGIGTAGSGATGTGAIKRTIYNSGSQTVWLGNSGVTTATGTRVLAGGTRDIYFCGAIYGVVSTGTGSVDYDEVY